MADITKKYTNGEVTIVWQPALCTHSAKCFTGLGEVFHPKELPWITPQHSTTEKIIEQVKQCPSGALSYYLNNTDAKTETPEAEGIRIEPSPNGPLLVYGNISVKDAVGNIVQKTKSTAFCRCGGSSNKPYCDGSHKRIGFQG